MVDLSTGSEIGRLDIHSPVNFQPESYEFVGCYHNTFSFYASPLNNIAERMRGLLAQNPRPHGPGDTQCDHCGAHIAFVGVFRHKVTGECIAVGQICAENRFPLTNAEFQALRKAHRLDSARRRGEAKFEEFKQAHPEVDWVAAEASTSSYVRSILAAGRKYGSLFGWKLDQLVRAMQPAPASVQAPAAPVTVSPEQAYLRAYNGSNSFLNSLKSQDAAGRTLSPKQLACVRDNIARAQRATDPAAQAKAQANQQLVPGIYIATDGTIWKVQGNMTYKSAAKRAVQAKVPFDPSTVSGARLYALVWTAGEARLSLSEVNDLSASAGWVFVKGAIATLDIDHKMNVDEAKHFATIYSQCVWCGRHLENTASYGTKFIEQGIGPVCIKYIDATVKAPEIDPATQTGLAS